MKRIDKKIVVFAFIALFILLFPISSFAGNNDSLPSYSYTGKGIEGYEFDYWYSAMRISI